jgi:hypothetical protein
LKNEDLKTKYRLWFLIKIHPRSQGTFCRFYPRSLGP